MTEAEAYIAFNLTEQVGSAKVAKLAAAAGSVAAAWEAYPSKVARTGGEVDWRGELAKAARYGVRILTPADPDYPARLRAVGGHPLALYVKGDAAVLSKPAIALVGTRRATEYGREQAYRFGRDLAADGWAVVSGLALGIDAEAHRGALAASGATYGVIGSGLDRFYPEENRDLAREIVAKGGAVVSEFPFGRPPDQHTFPIRNRVVAALASGTLVVEAPMKSGALITAGIAVDLLRTVMAVPGRVDSRMAAGTLHLIREGATLVRDAADVTEAMGSLAPARPPQGDGNAEALAKAAPAELPPFNVEESLVMRYVDAEGLSMDELARLTELPVMKVNSLCMTLRIKGRLRFLPGNRVALPFRG